MYVLQVLLGRVASWQELQCVAQSTRVNSGGASKQSKPALVQTFLLIVSMILNFIFGGN